MSGVANQLDTKDAQARNRRLFGSDAEPAPLMAMQAGPLRLGFDPGNGFVRGVRLGEREVLRGIYAAVRDRNWGTVRPHISNLSAEISKEAFSLEFDAECRQEEIHFSWHGAVQGAADGSVRYTFNGEAMSTFLRNRIGFCVLHPALECVGARARQRRTDGSVVECRFPQNIEPQIFGQGSFRDLCAVAHEVGPDLWAEVEFGGDIFETEDQRNWTDASFKTYCTPLALAFPVEIKTGTRICQSVTLRLLGSLPVPSRGRVETSWEDPDTATLDIPEAPRRTLPRIGLGMASHGGQLTDGEVTRLRSLQLAHLRADVRLASPHWRSFLQLAASEAERLGVPLELAVHLPRETGVELQQVTDLLGTNRTPLARVLALRDGEPATSEDAFRQFRGGLASQGVPLGVGSDANFCELNREQALRHLPLPDADFVFWSVNPQVHAYDHLSIMETLEAQPATVNTARAFAGSKPLVISPVTLKPRFNAVATGTISSPRLDELPAAVDPRQRSLFAAVWTLGTLAALAESGIESATFYETTGWRGVMERECGSSLPERFPSSPGEAFPLFTLFGQLAGYDRFAPLAISRSSQLAALAVWDAKNHRRVLLANLTPQTRLVRLVLPSERITTRVWTADNVFRRHGDPDDLSAQSVEPLIYRNGAGILKLPSYAMAFVDVA